MEEMDRKRTAASSDIPLDRRRRVRSATDGLARSGPIRMLTLKRPARAIEDCHQVGNYDNKWGCQQYANHCSQQNVRHAGILTSDNIGSR